jgi:ribosomal protein S18 acetylase RimI-like enzyme
VTRTVGRKRGVLPESEWHFQVSVLQARGIGSVAGSPGFRVEVLTENDWHRLRDIRLTALSADPTAFLSSHDTEAAYDERRWRREFARGEWHVVVTGAACNSPGAGLIGVTRVPCMTSQECFLEYFWVAERIRGAGVGSLLLGTVLDRLRAAGVHTVWLWVLDGNDDVMRLYRRFGFQSTNVRQPLPGSPERVEEKLRLRLR